MVTQATLVCTLNVFHTMNAFITDKPVTFQNRLQKAFDRKVIKQYKWQQHYLAYNINALKPLCVCIFCLKYIKQQRKQH